MAASKNGNGASAEVLRTRTSTDEQLTLIELSPGAVLVLPTKLLKDLCALQKTAFFGRVTTYFEAGRVIRSELLMSEVYVYDKNGKKDHEAGPS